MGAEWGILDWVFIAGGWTLAGLGAVALLWALFRDRARGRRRCPGCWYDMAGVPGLVCPECGREARRERRLRRTRRRWRWAAAACLVLLAGVAILRIPSIRRTGWIGQVPSTVLVLGLPWWEAAPPPTPATPGTGPFLILGPAPAATPLTWRQQLYAETRGRLHRGDLAAWQASLLAGRAASGDRSRPIGSAGWDGHYREFIDYLWSRTLAGKRGLAITDGGLDRARRRYLAPRVSVVRLAPDRIAVSVADLPRDADLRAGAEGDAAGAELRSPPLREAGCWPWCDSLSDPIAIDPGAGTARVVIHASAGGSPAWRLGLDVPAPPVREVVPIESERLGNLLASRLVPGLCTFAVYGHFPTLWLDPGCLSDGPTGLTMALRLEVLYDGRPFATGGAWWRLGSSTLGSGGGRPGGELIRLTRVDPQGTASFARPDLWALRITGDPAAALRDPEATCYWQGSVTVPLRIRNDGFPWPRRD